MNDFLGIVASGSKSDEMIFYSSNTIETDFVMIKHKKGKTIYKINNVIVENKRFVDHEFFKYVGDGDDYSRYNTYIARAIPIASINKENKKYTDYWFIGLPGSRVEIASAEDIIIVYDIGMEVGRQHIGSLIKRNDIPVWIDFKKFITTHMAVVGRSGQGKSNFIKIVLENLPMQYIVFTPTNEYIGVHNGNHKDLEKVSIPRDIKMLQKVLDLNSSETKLLNRAIEELFDGGIMEMSKLAEKIKDYYLIEPKSPNSEMNITMRNSSYINSLCNKLQTLNFVIKERKKVVINQSYIFNMQKLSKTQQEISIFLYLDELLNSRRQKYEIIPEGEEIPDRIVIFLEEAHNYIPSTKTSFCKEVINSIAREGRKLGLHLVLLSQRPRYLDPTTLSQCGSIVTFNLTNPDDIDYIMSNANFYGSEYKKNIQQLKIGECTVVSDYLEKEVSCKIRLLEN